MSDYYIENTADNRHYLWGKGYSCVTEWNVSDKVIRIIDSLSGEKLIETVDQVIYAGGLYRYASECPVFDDEGFKKEEFIEAIEKVKVLESISNKPSQINETLDSREENYGKFSGQAGKSQSIKDAMQKYDEWDKLSVSQKESLEMIAHKIARILNGKGADYVDNWHDIAGYATLVERELKEGE